ncbi:MFS transporter [uncultured Draconibacterium sp.]|uniref:MFS transporter n=1 Tax=uncultured Draconibacterium sp. TaxID=1573823 RepID=UPI00321803C7
MSEKVPQKKEKPKRSTNRKHTRMAVSMVYFSMGLGFSSWASRIPDIKTALFLNDAMFGSILFALPVGQFLMMPFSGKLVNRYGSHNVLKFSLPAYTIALSTIGLVQHGWQLGIALFLFGVFGNMCNISVNTQGVAAEQLYGRPIMASFHGGWSLAGFTGALIGLILINFKVSPFWHFVLIIAVVWIIVRITYPYLLDSELEKRRTQGRRKFFVKPDSILLQLGVIGFFSMASEGAMFDWSGVYFKDVVDAPSSLVILGYTSFMIMMAAGRFLADILILKMGRKLLMQISGAMISGGLFTAVLFPGLISSTLGFMMVGLGVSSIVPSVYSSAGKHPTIPTGIALATVSSVSFLGFLMGPPLIGFISEAFGLRYSFAVIGVFGIGITLMVAKVKALASE